MDYYIFRIYCYINHKFDIESQEKDKEQKIKEYDLEWKALSEDIKQKYSEISHKFRIESNPKEEYIEYNHKKTKSSKIAKNRTQPLPQVSNSQINDQIFSSNTRSFHINGNEETSIADLLNKVEFSLISCHPAHQFDLSKRDFIPQYPPF